ncbi:MAG TPA: HAD family hydrolase [Terriglobales bacterium]|nr:HAD family hydrolase [Terriglobales bacterium]
MITHLFFDIGGVLLTNGWDHSERVRACAHFGLDVAEVEALHAPRAEALEVGALSMDDYLRQVIFTRRRDFTPPEFVSLMQSCSQPLPDSLVLLADLAAAGRTRLAALNNESRELNQYRIETYGLARFLSVFCSSCYLGARKPEAEIYRRACGILHADPAACGFVDDRAENLAVPRTLGWRCFHFASAATLRAELSAAGLL